VLTADPTEAAIIFEALNASFSALLSATLFSAFAAAVATAAGAEISPE
jgi:hypothetical protein